MTGERKSDGDLRMLGARDGYMHALIDVRQQIARHVGPYRRIDPRHTRMLKRRDEILRPLRELETKFATHLAAVKAAYEKTRDISP